MTIGYQTSNIFFMLTIISNMIGISQIGMAQQSDGGWRQKLIGTWAIDRPETAKLWKGTQLEQFNDALMMAPIASPSFTFTNDKIGFDLRPKKSTYSFGSFDAQKKEIVLNVVDEGFEFTQSLTVLSEDLLVVNTAISMLGPSRIVYRRKSERKAIDEKTGSVLISKLFGEWNLEQDLTEKLWTASCNPDQLTNYRPTGRRALSGATTIKLAREELSFSDQTFLPWEILKEEPSLAVFRTQANRVVEIQLIQDGLIQVTYPEHGLCGIYSNSKLKKSEAVDKFPTSATLEKMIDSFSTQRAGRNRLNRVPPIGVSGNVSLATIKVERVRRQRAVVDADITNMTVGLFAFKELKHFGIHPKYHLQLNRLDDIVDNTGKKLLTEQRRGAIKSLQQFVIGNEMWNSDGKSGPVIHFKLEAPALGATSIDRIAGALQVAEVTSKLIRFDNLSAIAGKNLTHPIMGADSFVFNYNKERFPKASLHLKGSTREHFLDWYLTDRNGTRINSSSVGRNEQLRTIGFDQEIPDDGRIVIAVADFDEIRKSPFEFRNIRLAE